MFDWTSLTSSKQWMINHSKLRTNGVLKQETAMRGRSRKIISVNSPARATPLGAAVVYVYAINFLYLKDGYVRRKNDRDN